MRKRFRKAFNMIELTFVIMIMAILVTFFAEFLVQAYSSFIGSKVNSELQAKSAYAVEFIAKRLQHRIKASTIAREDNASFEFLRDYSGKSANIIEWVGVDIDGFRGDFEPYWSGVLDLNSSKTNSTRLSSPKTNTRKLQDLISVLSNANSGIDDAAIYFVDPDSLNTNWGWDGDKSKFNTQQGVPKSQNAIHPIKRNPSKVDEFLPVDADGLDNDFSKVLAFEFYKLAWSAYAIGIDNYNTTTNSGTLKLWYDYQPWRGESYKKDAKVATIMQGVSSFRFIARDSLVKIQVCVKSQLKNEEYSICKEKTVF